MAQKIRKKDKIDRTVSKVYLPNDHSKKGKNKINDRLLSSNIVNLNKEDLIVKIIDSISRRSWVYLHICVPKLQVEIEDWFHVYSADGEYLKVDYGFTQTARGNANDRQLVSMLNKLTKYVIDYYVYLDIPYANNSIGIIRDRFDELDNRPYFKNFMN